MFRATVPEAAVHEHGDPFPTEQHIDPAAGQPGNRSIDEVTEAAAVELPSERQLGTGVPARRLPEPLRDCFARGNGTDRVVGHPGTVPLIPTEPAVSETGGSGSDGIVLIASRSRGGFGRDAANSGLDGARRIGRSVSEPGDYLRWAAGLTSSSIRSLFRDLGCDVVFRKRLAPNDNTKNQIYLAADLTELALLPSGPPTTRRGSSGRRSSPGAPIFWAPLNLEWITDTGRAPAPEAKLIYYPQYPEVRASGLLQGSRGAPNFLLDPQREGRSNGRVLLLGVSSHSDRVHALLLPPEVPATGQLAVEHVQPYGVLDEWRIRERDGAGPDGPRNLLLHELSRVHDLGWIRSCRLTAEGRRIDYSAPNGAGFTLEAELGVTPNGHAAPDFMGWEVKQHAVRSFRSPSFGQITLFTPEPDGGVYASEGAVEFVRRWGRFRDGATDRMEFTGIHTVGRIHQTTSLRLELHGLGESRSSLDPDGCVALVSSTDELCATWSFAKLLGHWKRKHAAAAFVRSERRLGESTDELVSYRFGSTVQLCEGATFERLLAGFSSGLIRYDPGLHIDRRPGEPWRPRKRNQFRVSSRPEQLASLYETSELVEVGERSDHQPAS